MGIIELVSESTFRFKRFSYSSNSIIFSEDVTFPAKINFRSLFIYYVHDTITKFYIGARRIAAPHQYCLILYQHFSNTKKQLMDVPHQIEKLMMNSYPSSHNVVTVGLDSKRMIFSQNSPSVFLIEDSFVQENSIIRRFDISFGLAASKNSNRISKFDMITLSNIEFVSLDLTNVQAVNLIDVKNTEYFIVHDPDASSFLLGHDTPSL